jgi:chromosome segregation ATPase
MADDMTPGEIRRSIDRIEGSQREAHKAIDDRLAEVARKSVPVELWQSEQKALADDVKHLESDFRDAVDRIERTSQERMTTLRGEIGTVRKAQADHVKEHKDSGAWSRSRTLTVIAIVVGATATLAAAWIAAFAAAGGVR